jgi:hypothetical protein
VHRKGHDVRFEVKNVLLLFSEVFSGCHPAQVVEQRKNQRSEDHQHPEDGDRDGLRNVGFLTVQPLDPADSPRELHFTQSPGKQQILLLFVTVSSA